MFSSRTLRYFMPTLKLITNCNRNVTCIPSSLNHRFNKSLGEISSPVNIVLNGCIPHRSKKTSSKKDEDSDEEDWDSEDRSLGRDSKLIKFKVPSMRMDLVLKSSLGVARNKIEKIFYDSKTRLNGKKVLKKSMRVNIGDEIDVIKGFSPKNTAHILVTRVEILNAAVTSSGDDEQLIQVSVRRFKSLLIENYQQDPYKESTADTN